MIEMKGNSNRNCPIKEEEEEENWADSNSRRRDVLSFLSYLKNRPSTTMKRNCLRRLSDGETFSSFTGESGGKRSL